MSCKGTVHQLHVYAFLISIQFFLKDGKQGAMTPLLLPPPPNLTPIGFTLYNKLLWVGDPFHVYSDLKWQM